MAQDITLLGVDYSDVPAVELPKTGGGTASFTDVTDTTAVAADVAQGKVFYLADGSQATGTSSGGGGGGGSVTKSDVNFYDYDGTLVASCTKAEIDAMSSDSDLPDNPSHTGLTAQGWNWTLTQLKAQLAAMPNQPVNVGQIYVTDDDKTRIYVHFEEGRSSPYFGICPNGTVTVDWGDGSATSTLTGTSLTTVKTAQHVYAPGNYVITLTAASGTTFAFYGTSNTSHILKKSTSAVTNVNRVYTNAVQKIELGSAAQIGNYAFYNCQSLTTITLPDNIKYLGLASSFYGCYSLSFIAIPAGVGSLSSQTFYNCYSLSSVAVPSSVTSIGTYVFNSCYSLASVTIPDSVTSIGTYVFNNCYSLASVTIPDSVTSIESNAFRYCYSLTSVTIPDSVTSIGTYVFNSCYGLGEIHFKSTTPPTVSNSNTWTSIPTDCKIYVPAGTLEDYTTATNYPSSSTYTYIEE